MECFLIKSAIMKKLFVAILLTSGLSISSYAQLNVGLKLNGTLNNFFFKDADNIKFIRYNYADSDLFGLGGGTMANYKLSRRFSIQSELIYDAVNARFAKWVYYSNWNGDRDRSGNDFSVKMRYLEIPLLGKISFGRKVTFDLFAGGFAGFLLRAKQSTSSGQLNLPEDVIYYPYTNAPYHVQKSIDYAPHDARAQYTTFNAGVLAGLGMTIRDALVFELRIKRGLVNINKADDGKMHTIQGQFTVGYYIFRQKKKL